MYPKSQQEAGLDWSVQKDVWHIERDGSQVRRDLERAAFRSTKQVLKVQRQLLKAWDDSVFEQQYIPAVEQEKRLYDQHALFSEWLAHLGDALELVDWRSGEIRDRSINEWLLEETLTAMERIDHVRVRKWVKKLRRHQTQLLTSLDWLAEALQAYWEQLAQLPWTPKAQQSFTRLVARCWRLRQAVINGHTAFNSQVQQAEAALQILITDNPQRQHMADRLIELLDAGCRASSLIECINGLLQQFLHNRRAFRNLETLQLYLNLFTLWHNMRVYERGKRKGKSPYQLAGIDLGTDDWLSLIGYPAD